MLYKTIISLLLVFSLCVPICSADTKAKRIRITDTGSYFVGTNVETALQEIGAGTIGAVYFLKLDGSNANTDINIGSYNFITTGNLTGDTITTMGVPATSASTGTTGSIAEDADYVYICIATDTWKRIPLSAWGAPGDKILMSDGTSNILMSDGTSVILMSN